MPATSDSQGENILVRRMRRARIRQWAVAISSVLTAAVGVAFLSPVQIGNFAYYTISFLLLLNATFALRQSVCVIFPIETLLRKIRLIERDVEAGKFNTAHFSIHSNDAFACLTAGIENLLTLLSEKARASSDKVSRGEAMLHAIPFTLFTVSRTGKIYSIVKDEYGLVPDLELEVGKRPSEDAWGESNAARFVKSVATSFTDDRFQWFDLNIGTHHLRGCVRRISELTSLVALGDMPAIDKRVADMSGASSEYDFTHRQNALKRFAATLAHDAKNVFAALGNLIEINKASTDSAVRELVPVAEDAIRRGTQLMNELMQYAGETKYTLKTMSAVEACSSVLESPTLQAMVPDNIKLITDVSVLPMPDIDADTDQMWKVVLNLVKNSVEAIGQANGRIWLQAAPFTMTAEEEQTFQPRDVQVPSQGVLITESDDGPGIDPMIIGHLFEPYISSKGRGRGLGLAKMQTVVDAHNGAVRVRSKRGRGTSFDIFIPASRHTVEELRMIREVAPNGEILLVDDDPMILRTTQLVLQNLKIAAHPAANETDALHKIRSLGPRLRAVLADAHLGGEVSTGLLRKIHELRPGLHVILTSGSDETALRSAFAGIPYDGFLAKPYTAEELAGALKKAER